MIHKMAKEARSSLRAFGSSAAAGCRWVTTDTGPNQPDVDTTSYRNMERAGFVPAYDRPCWIRV
jgi:hypothetical protein